MSFLFSTLMGVFLFFSFYSMTFAQEESVPEEIPVNQTSGDAPATVEKPKGKRVYEKREAEGSQAPDRFEAEAGIKSQYRYNGQPLEVDPD